MRKIVTSEQFITGVLCEMALKGNRTIKLVDTVADERFERAFEHLLTHSEELGVEPDFSLTRNAFHGDSETLRETLYALRESGVVAINNPSFKTVEVKLSNEEARSFFANSPLPENLFRDVVMSYFAGGESEVDVGHAAGRA